MKRIPMAAAALLLLAALCVPCEARIIVSPLELHFEVSEGDRGGMPIIVTNRGNRHVTLKLYFGDSRLLPDGSEENMLAGGHRRSCAPWMLFADQILELDPGKSEEIPVVLEVPEGARGTFWTKLYVEEISTGVNPPGDEASLPPEHPGERVAVRLFENVPGTIHRLARIEEIAAPPATGDVPATVSVRVKNTGNALLHCRGWVELHSSDGSVVDTLRLGRDNRFLLYPDSYRNLVLESEKPLDEGTYTALAMIDMGESGLLSDDALLLVRRGMPGAVSPAPVETVTPVGVPEETAVTSGEETTAGMKIAPPVERRAGFSIQVEADALEEEALKTVERLAEVLDEEPYIHRSRSFYKVLVGRCEGPAEADILLRKVTSAGFPGAFVVPAEAAIETPTEVVADDRAATAPDVVDASAGRPDGAEVGDPENGAAATVETVEENGQAMSDTTIGAPAAIEALGELLPDLRPLPEAAGYPPRIADSSSAAPAASGWRLLIFSASDSAGAAAYAAKIEAKFAVRTVISGTGSSWKIHLAGATDRASAVKMMHEMITAGMEESWIERGSIRLVP